MEIRRIQTQISIDQIEEGYFTFDGATLRQVKQDGTSVHGADGSPVQRVVLATEDPERCARQILRASINHFDRPINYRDSGGWR